MDNEYIEDLARSMHRQYCKEMFGEARSWEKCAANERSIWRLLVRTVLARAKEKSASPVTPVVALMTRTVAGSRTSRVSRRA
jgi:hypothetical protein